MTHFEDKLDQMENPKKTFLKAILEFVPEKFPFKLPASNSM